MKSLKNPFLFFVLFFLTVNYMFCQKQDSIELYYEQAKDMSESVEYRQNNVSKVLKLLEKDKTNKLYLKALNTKSFLFNRQKQFDSALVYAEILLDKSILANDLKMQKLAYEKLADYSRLNTSLVNAFNYYDEFKKISIKSGDTLAAVKALQYIASIQNVIGLPFESEKSSVECLKLLELINETPKVVRAKVGIYNQLGIIYKDLKNYKRSLELYNVALSKTNNAIYKINISNNKANVYREQGNLEEAESILNFVYESTLKNQTLKQQNQALDNLGFVQSKLNKPIGIKNLEKALLLRKEDNDSFGIYTSHMHMAEYFLDNNNTVKAEFHSQEAYLIAEKLNSSIYRLEALALLGKLSSDSKVAEYIYLKDSISEAKLSTTNKYASVKYDYTKQELIAKENELEKEKEKRLKLFYKSIGVLIFLSSIFLLLLLRAKHKKANLQNVFNTEARISKKVHDEVANDIYHVMTKLQNEHNINDIVLDDLESVYIKTRDISKEISAILVTENFDQVLTDLFQSYKNERTNIITKNLYKIDWESFSKLKKMVIYRVLQELMINMRKHSKATYVVINFEELRGCLKIMYQDNGVGTTLKKANGLQNVENRISGIKGTVIFESEINKGFKAIIKV
ncbi:tetratricopeptide repeat-containing sensor histidine kinase [Lacinutrix chionoecetis]